MDATSQPVRGNVVVTIPEFQRRLVWSKKKQEDLISSIRKGYPFGSIMMYEDYHTTQSADDGKKYFSLIDGLQRTHALRSYVKSQNSFYNRTLVPNDIVNHIARGLGRSSRQGKSRVRQTLVKWVNSIPTFEARDGWGSTGLLSALVNHVLSFQTGSEIFHREFAKLSMDWDFQQVLGEFLDLTSSDARSILDVRVPVMFYNGTAEHVPQVFRLLNSKGAQLNKYEILAAQWVNERRVIANHAIIDEIWMKNRTVEEQGFVLEVTKDTSGEESRFARSYSLYDYLFGLGRILPREFPRLFKEAKSDRPNSVSFNLVTACFGLHTAKMGDLPTMIEGLDLSAIEDAVIQSISFVDRQLNPLLGPKQNGRAKSPIYHSELMIVAIIATAFQARYGIRDLSENDGWTEDRGILKQRIPMFYLYEFLQDDWRGSGDSKLHDRVREFRYLRLSPPDADRWNQVLDNWYYDNQIDYVHDNTRSRHIYDSRPEYLLLRYIFSSRLEATGTYHVEHIIPTSFLQAAMNSGEEWPISSVCNLALLSRAGDLKDNDQPYTQMLQHRLSQGEITVEQYHQQQVNYATQMICPPEILPASFTKQSYEDFLQARFELLKSEFLDVWRDHISQDPST